MMRSGRGLALGLAAAIILAVTPASATFHIMVIAEVFAGSTAHPSAQYIELEMRAAGQNLVNGHPVTVYDASGTQVGQWSFSANVSNSAAGSSILVATSQAHTLFGVTPDLVMTAVIPSGGGKACFDTVDCVTWGSYAGPGGVGTPFSQAEGILAGSSMTRTATGGPPTTDSASAFTFASPSPRNNAGTVGTVSCAPGFAATSSTVAENAGSAVITVSGCPSSTVQYSTADGTATAGSDYTSASGTLTFGPADSSLTFSVPITNDSVSEPTETVSLELRSQSTEFLGRANAILSITNVSPPPTPPSAPQNLTATAAPGQISLSWSIPSSSGNTAITGYRIYRGTASGNETFLTTVGVVLSFTDTGLAAGATRYYQVSAFNGAEGPRSNEASATTPPAAPPSPPLNLNATPSAGRVDLVWSAPSNNGGAAVSSYKVYRGPNASSLAYLATRTVTTFADTSLTAGTTFFYAVSAVNIAGEGPQSAVVSAKTPVPPAAPANVTAQPGGGVGQILISWNAPASNGGSTVTGYKVYRDDVLLQTVNGTTFVDSGRTVLQSYTYRVSAINAVGEGDKSAGSCTKPFPWLAALGCLF